MFVDRSFSHRPSSSTVHDQGRRGPGRDVGEGEKQQISGAGYMHSPSHDPIGAAQLQAR